MPPLDGELLHHQHRDPEEHEERGHDRLHLRVAAELAHELVVGLHREHRHACAEDRRDAEAADDVREDDDSGAEDRGQDEGERHACEDARERASEAHRRLLEIAIDGLQPDEDHDERVDVAIERHHENETPPRIERGQLDGEGLEPRVDDALLAEDERPRRRDDDIGNHERHQRQCRDPARERKPAARDQHRERAAHDHRGRRHRAAEDERVPERIAIGARREERHVAVEAVAAVLAVEARGERGDERPDEEERHRHEGEEPDRGPRRVAPHDFSTTSALSGTCNLTFSPRA